MPVLSERSDRTIGFLTFDALIITVETQLNVHYKGPILLCVVSPLLSCVVYVLVHVKGQQRPTSLCSPRASLSPPHVGNTGLMHQRSLDSLAFIFIMCAISDCKYIFWTIRLKPSCFISRSLSFPALDALSLLRLPLHLLLPHASCSHAAARWVWMRSNLTASTAVAGRHMYFGEFTSRGHPLTSSDTVRRLERLLSFLLSINTAAERTCTRRPHAGQTQALSSRGSSFSR